MCEREKYVESKRVTKDVRHLYGVPERTRMGFEGLHEVAGHGVGVFGTHHQGIA